MNKENNIVKKEKKRNKNKLIIPIIVLILIIIGLVYYLYMYDKYSLNRRRIINRPTENITKKTKEEKKHKKESKNYELGNGKPIKIEVTDENIIKELHFNNNKYYTNFSKENKELKFYKKENNKVYFVGSYKCVNKECDYDCGDAIDSDSAGVFEITDGEYQRNNKGDDEFFGFTFLYDSINNKISEKFINNAGIIDLGIISSGVRRYIVRNCLYNGKDRALLLNENFKIIGIADYMGTSTGAMDHIGNITNYSISITENNKGGIMSLEDGSYIISPKFDGTIYNLSKNTHIVESNGKMFEIDKKGNIISNKYDYLNPIGNGYYIAIIDKKGYVLDNKYKKVTEPIKLYTNNICGYNCCCGSVNPIESGLDENGNIKIFVQLNKEDNYKEYLFNTKNHKLTLIK